MRPRSATTSTSVPPGSRWPPCGRWGDLGLHVDPCEFPPGQHLPRPFLGGVGEPFSSVPQPGVGAARGVRLVPDVQILPRRRDAPPRRRRRTLLLPLQAALSRCLLSGFPAAVLSGGLSSALGPASRPGCRLLCPVAASPLSGLRFFAGSLCDFRAPEAL